MAIYVAGCASTLTYIRARLLAELVSLSSPPPTVVLSSLAGAGVGIVIVTVFPTVSTPSELYLAYSAHSSFFLLFCGSVHISIV